MRLEAVSSAATAMLRVQPVGFPRPTPEAVWTLATATLALWLSMPGCEGAEFLPLEDELPEVVRC